MGRGSRGLFLLAAKKFCNQRGPHSRLACCATGFFGQHAPKGQPMLRAGAKAAQSLVVIFCAVALAFQIRIRASVFPYGALVLAPVDRLECPRGKSRQSRPSSSARKPPPPPESQAGECPGHERQRVVDKQQLQHQRRAPRTNDHRRRRHQSPLGADLRFQRGRPFRPAHLSHRCAVRAGFPSAVRRC